MVGMIKIKLLYIKLDIVAMLKNIKNKAVLIVERLNLISDIIEHKPYLF